MGKPTSVIEINGSRYDATTGKLISATISSVNNVKNQVIDGFVKAPAAISQKKKSSNPKPIRRTVKQGASHLHKRTQKAQTLMRGAVKNPASNFNSRLQHLTAIPRPDTQLRAKLTPKHPRVEHYGNPIKSAHDARPNVIHAKTVPRHHHQATHVKQNTVSAPLPSMVTSASHHKLERLLDEALTKADAHKQALQYHAAKHFWQKPNFRGRYKILTFSLVVIAVLALGFFVVWQKVPQVSVKLAGTKAGVSATVPKYTPSGYKPAAPAAAQQKAVKIDYKSTDGAQSYTITQQPSNLSSTSLSQSVVPQNTPVQTSQVDGNTVYIYGPNNNAAWVNNGVLYTIDSQANLSSDQVLNIVKGL